MRKQMKLLLVDRVNKYGIYLSFISTIVGFIFLLLRFTQLPPMLPLFYHRPWGIPQLGTPNQLLLILAGSIFVLCINLTFATLLYKTSALLARVLIWSCALISLLAATTIIRVILLVT